MQGVDACALLEHFTRQMACTAIAAAAVVQLGGVGLGVGNQVSQAVDLELLCLRCIHDQHIGHPHHLRDGHEVFGCIERHAAVEPRVHRMGGCGRDANGQPVRRSLGNRIGPDVAARTALVVDDDRAQRIAHTLCQGACRHVNRPARGIRNDDSDGLPGVLRQDQG